MPVKLLVLYLWLVYDFDNTERLANFWHPHKAIDALCDALAVDQPFRPKTNGDLHVPARCVCLELHELHVLLDFQIHRSCLAAEGGPKFWGSLEKTRLQQQHSALVQALVACSVAEPEV